MSRNGKSRNKPEPLDKGLYEQAKRETIRKFNVYPSAYANSYLVKRYKDLGGRYSSKGVSREESNLKRWYDEEWVDITRPRRNSTGYKQCGRKSVKSGRYPVCRPSVRVSSKTPLTVNELPRYRRTSAIRRKRQTPQKRIKF